MSDPLGARVAAALERDVRPEIAAYAEMLADEAGASAVLFYGSNLRTGSLEGVLDFYLLLPGSVERGIWPRVYYREWMSGGQVLRAKVATMTLATFEKAAAGETLDTTIWARFVQPSALVWHRGAESQARVVAAVEAAAVTAARLAAALGPEAAPEDAFWRALFRETYRAELRVEQSGREDTILKADPRHFAGLLATALEAGGLKVARHGEQLRPMLSPAARARICSWWKRRRRLGKPLNIVRLMRAVRTFAGSMRYAAWKIERHTGLPIELTPWRERHPLLAAPGVLWAVWRARRQVGSLRRG